MFSPFSTGFGSSLTLVDSAGPAKLRVLLQLIEIGWMELARSAQQGLEVFVFFFVDHFRRDEVNDPSAEEACDFFDVCEARTISSCFPPGNSIGDNFQLDCECLL